MEIEPIAMEDFLCLETRKIKLNNFEFTPELETYSLFFTIYHHFQPISVTINIAISEHGILEITRLGTYQKDIIPQTEKLIKDIKKILESHPKNRLLFITNKLENASHIEHSQDLHAIANKARLKLIYWFFICGTIFSLMPHYFIMYFLLTHAVLIIGEKKRNFKGKKWSKYWKIILKKYRHDFILFSALMGMTEILGFLPFYIPLAGFILGIITDFLLYNHLFELLTNKKYENLNK
jgi:hypothetical protein